MNYLVLKTILQNAISTFSCPHCESRIQENSLFIKGFTQEGLSLVVDCPKCHRHTEIQAAFRFFPGSASPMSSSGLSATVDSQSQTISDEMIRTLHHEIRSIEHITDLFPRP